MNPTLKSTSTKHLAEMVARASAVADAIAGNNTNVLGIADLIDEAEQLHQKLLVVYRRLSHPTSAGR